MRSFVGLIGVVIALFSSLLMATSLVEICGHGDGKTPVSVLVGVFVFFTGTTALASYLAWRMFRRSGRAPGAVSGSPRAEQRVLALAVKLGGRTTVPEAAARCGLTMAESREVLDRLVVQGAAELLIAADGTMVYAISGLLTPQAKAAATDVTSA
jgi:hypothetical protein